MPCTAQSSYNVCSAGSFNHLLEALRDALHYLVSAGSIDFHPLSDLSKCRVLAVTIDDEDTDLDKPFQLKKTDVNITFNPYVPGIGEELVLDDGLFTFTTVAVKAFEDDISGYNR